MPALLPARPRSLRPLAAIAVLLALLAGGLTAATRADARATTWLCRPGLAKNPCDPGLRTTVFAPGGEKLAVQQPRQDKAPKVDCFYVYPTVSDQKTTLANFKIDPELRSIALYQAARYSQHCRVFAPVYRQVTITTLNRTGTETAAQLATGIGDVRAAFKDYLEHDNHGRGIVLIGHSQGSFVLRKLIAEDVDPKPAVRRKLLSAILLGGNVLVKKGSDVGGDFQHVRACHSATQLGCVVAFSTFDTPVLPNSKFGKSGSADREVLCTNPAALAGGSAVVDTILPSAPFAPGTTIAIGNMLLGITQPTASTPWVRESTSYRAECSSADDANVLQITPIGTAPSPKPAPDGTWGLHLLDANVALGDLVGLVKAQAAAFAKR